MTTFDDLRKGDWIAITAVRDDEEHEFHSMPFLSSPRQRPRYAVNGKPLKVLAISLPFIAVTDGVSRYALNSYYVSVRKVSKQYVAEMYVENEQHRQENVNVCYVKETKPERQRKKRKQDRRGLCPQCGDRLVQRRVGMGLWAWVCNDCGFTGGNSLEQ